MGALPNSAPAAVSDRRLSHRRRVARRLRSAPAIPPEISGRLQALAAAGTGAVVQWAHDLDLVHRLDRLVIERLGGVHQARRELGAQAPRIDDISVNISSGAVATPARQEELIALLAISVWIPICFVSN